MSHAVLHRWKVRRGKEDDFAAAWARLTDVMIVYGGAYGARLHRGEDGSYIAYSWWPSKQAWDRAQLQKSPARSLLAAAVEERLPEIHMTLVDERFPADEEPAAEHETPAEEPEFEAAADEFQEEPVAEEVAAEAEPEPEAEPERTAVDDFDPDDPNAPLSR